MIAHMTRIELLKIINFLLKIRENFGHFSEAPVSEPEWDVALYLTQQHLLGRLVTISSLISSSNTPYATGRRHVLGLIDKGMIDRRPRTASGKSFSLHPSAKLILEIEKLARSIKGLVGKTFGLDENNGSSSAYQFGGAFLASKILPTPMALQANTKTNRPLRILGQQNPTFEAYIEHSRYFSQLIGCDLQIELAGIDDMESSIFENAKHKKSKFDIVAVDLPWMGKLACKQVLRPLDEYIDADSTATGDFIASSWESGAYNGVQYSVPLQTTVELLFCVKDRFEADGRLAPETTEQLLDCARHYHHPSENRYGIIWLGAEGTALGHTFMQRMASFGCPILDLASTGKDFILPRDTKEAHRPVIICDEARQTAEFLKRLLEVSHDGVLQFHWHNSADIFKQNHTAMMLGWTVFICDLDHETPLFDNLMYCAPPKGPNGRHVSTLGGWNVGIPDNLSDKRAAQVWRYIRWLTSPEVIKAVVQHGSLNNPRISVGRDPDVREMHPIIEVINNLDEKGLIQTWPRPPVPEFSTFTSMIGGVMHEMLLDKITIKEALVSAQNKADAILGFTAAGK